MLPTVCLIPGDGIGPDVARAATRVLDAARVERRFADVICRAL